MEEDDEGSNGNQQCDNVSLQQSPWRRNKGKTQKKLVPHHLYTVHTTCVTIISEDIQIALQYT